MVSSKAEEWYNAISVIEGKKIIKKMLSSKAEELYKQGYEEQDMVKAIEYYTKALEIDPTYAEAWMRKGILLNLLKRYEEAISCYDKALEIHPSDHHVMTIRKFAEENLEGQQLPLSSKVKELVLDLDFSRFEDLFKLYEVEGEDVVSEITGLLDRKNCKARGVTFAPGNAAFALSRIEREYPGAIKDAVPNLISLLNDDSVLTSKSTFSKVTGALGEVAKSCPECINAAIPKLAKLLKDEDPNIRINATFAIAYVADNYPEVIENSISDLISSLSDPYPEDAIHALRGAGRKFPEEIEDAIPRLIELLDDEDSDVRISAATNLIIIRKNHKAVMEKYADYAKQKIQKLTSLLEDDDSDIREDAAYAISAIGPLYPEGAEERIPKLIRLLGDVEESGSRWAAAYALGEEGAVEALNPLKKLLKDEDSSLFTHPEKGESDYLTVGEMAQEAIKKISYNPAKEHIESSDFISSIESEIAEIKNSGIKTPKLDKVIEHAQSELKQNNFERAKELTKEAKRIALERKERYNLASDSLSASEKVFNEIKNEGVIMSGDLLAKTKQAFDTGDYEEAKKLSEELQDVINTTAKKYREAQEELKSADSSIEKAKEFGCNVLDFEDRLTNVEQLFENGAYEEVIETSKQIGELVKKIREEAKPEIKISLSQTSFKPNAWKRIDNIITNTGSATAKAIKVEYPKERVEIEGLMAAEELKPNGEKTLKITIRPIHEGEVPLTAKITYMDLDNKEYKGEQSFWITVGENVGEKGKQITTIEIKRSFVELPNNDLKFGIRIINNTEYMIADVKTILDYPRTLFSLKDNVVQTLANISPNGKRTAKYRLTPLGCIHNEKIDAIISYNDHTGKKQTVQMRPKEVHCVCPFLKEKVIREGEFAELANTCERIEEGLSFSGIGVTELTEVIKESCAHRLYVISEHEIETTKIVYLAGESIGEKAYYLLTAVIQHYKNLTQVALRACSDKPYGLHGFLNEIASSIRYLVGSVQSAKEIGIIESKQVINIIDSVVQRTNIGGTSAEGTGTATTNIEGSVVQRTEIGSVRWCPNCGKGVQEDEKFCTGCGARLE